jgi:hypothetical protein
VLSVALADPRVERYGYRLMPAVGRRRPAATGAAGA